MPRVPPSSIAAARARPAAPPPAPPPKRAPKPTADGDDPQRNFRFFDNRQKYLLFVNTCSEKWVIASRVALELANIHPRPPAVRVFDAGVGDGTVLLRVLRAMHDRFPHMPFYVVGKEISLEDVRVALQKMSDRFFEHPATVLVLTNLAYADAPWLAVKSLSAASSLVWHEVPLAGNSAYRFEQQITDLVPFLSQNWKAGVSPKTGNPVYERPVVLVIYREDHKFLLDPIIPRPGGTVANYDLVMASQPYRARAPLDFKAKRVIAPLAKALGPSGRLIGIHSHGNDPGLEIIRKVWPDDNPFTTDRHALLKAVKQELGPAGRDLNFNAYADNRSLFRYDMHTLPSEISEFDRHLDAVRRLERGDLCGASGGGSAGRRGGERALPRCHPRGAAQARRALVLRRILRDLAPARVDRACDDTGRFIRGSRCGGARRPLHARLLARGDPADRGRDRGARRLAPSRHAGLPERGTNAAAGRDGRAGAALRAAGFEPVPHIAVRHTPTADALGELIACLAAEAGVRRILVIAGDRDRPAGPFGSTIELIESGLLQRHGIIEIGVAGYPDGHPRLSADALDRALAAKVEAAGQTGLRLHIVTQFCFDADPILRWLARLRDTGIEHPVRIGLAGPTTLTTLLRYARRCGVSASAQGLTRHAGLFKHLVGTTAPDGIIRTLAEAAPGTDRRDRPAFLLVRRCGRDRALGAGGRRRPHHARSRGRLQRASAVSRSTEDRRRTRPPYF